MIIDLSQVASYQSELDRAIAKAAEAKRDMEYLRLQIKQTKEAAARAKKDDLVKAFVAKYGKDNVEVMPAPGLNWVSVHVRPNEELYHFDPVELGLTFKDAVPANDRLNAHVLWRYTSHSVVYYVIKHPF